MNSSSQQKLIVFSAALLSISVLAGVMLTINHQEPSATDTIALGAYPSDQDTVNMIDGPSIAEFNQLKAELQQLKQAIKHSAKTTSNSAQTAETSSYDEESQIMSADDSPQGLEEKQALYTAQVMSEPVDIEWSRETLNQVETALMTEELQGIDLISSACGSTLCQLEMEANDLLPVEESMQRLSILRPWDGPTFFKMADDGKVTLFFARSGHTLPEEGFY